ncbi:MAG: hypothetical protein K9I59_06440 [Chlorobium sp.]|jgi:iron complex transport system ATP-binding protein|nr:hypothetical protein [Chlorobium sp.]MBN1279697.1 hypothetical protein [Chlorobiaceae bacterium]MCF8216412.1 hypothetical protein [Chlorobium sp.]MCF8271315.1 hypothetical protein [Chlorobium sp.]MCF8287689.1 hypothetical protein [Chlorobium sp.]MCF8291228.1 hypothetical protein [Chlorobium sp.]
MDQPGISHLNSRHFGVMSTGEQCRFLLGRAQVNDPDTLLFDEQRSGFEF